MAEGGVEDKGRGGGAGPCDLPPPGVSSPVPRRQLTRGIVIQLTGTEGDWDTLEDSELIFPLDHDEDDPPSSVPEKRQLSVEDDRRLQSQGFHVPVSPSSPGSLGTFSAPAAPSFLSPAERPLAGLAKSLSTELEPKDGSNLRPRPFLSLVKSISAEISRSEPEVSQSKSDSRLNLHLWKQLTQTRTRGDGDSRTAPPSPSAVSPGAEALKGGFFKMELEDTRRKLSEAVQEPLSSMFNKILREDSPKHQSRTQGGSKGLGRDGSTETGVLDSPVRSSRRTDGNSPSDVDWPLPRHHSSCPLHHSRTLRDQDLEIQTDGDTMQVFAIETPRPQTRRVLTMRPPRLPQPPLPLPRMGLFLVALLSYGYFILPLSPYLSGLALGLALGFLLGLWLIRMDSSSPPSSDQTRPVRTLLGEGILTGGSISTEPETLQGWMNEIQDYDPETCHPALTQSVFASLDGSRLRLDSPRTNVSRRATYDERLNEATFVKSRRFQLANSKVFLLPSALARKRLWNPKYPICIQLPDSQEEEPGPGPADPGPGLADPGPGLADPEPGSSKAVVLYLFGRTGREKEEWFRHFLLASMDPDMDNQRPGRCGSRPGDSAQPLTVSVQANVSSSEDDASSLAPPLPTNQTASGSRGLSLMDYPAYMTRLLADEEPPLPDGTETSATAPGNCTCDVTENSGTTWANALIGRIFWDFLLQKHWTDAVSTKIQKKLSRIRLPYFMNELTLTELDMGSSIPQITETSRPEVNHRGLWVELQLVYTGSLQMTLQTKFNLSKLGKEDLQDPENRSETSSSRPVLSVLADSDEESSSSEEEDLVLTDPLMGDKGSTPAAEGSVSGRTSRKILRFVDKIAKSKYFQKAKENEFIKKKFEEMSNMPLLLTVEVQELSGPLVINIPPPPTDRIWYSFCAPPRLELHVRPKLGQREVTFYHVTEWIEKKLQDEFQKVFVLPNMDDIYLPMMHSGVDSPHTSNPPTQRSRSCSTESIERIDPEAECD